VRIIYKAYLAFSLIALLAFAGCGIFVKGKDPILQKSPYEGSAEQKTAIYGKVVDFATQEKPRYPVKLFLEPDDPGNHIVVDSQYFFISSKDLEPDYDYMLKIRAQYYAQQELPFKYIPGKTQNLGTIQMRYLETRMGNFPLPPYEGFNPGSGIIEKHGWSLSSFLDSWRANYGDMPFKFENVAKYIDDTLGESAESITKDQIVQAIREWLDQDLIEKYGRQSYKLK
jgi:hypothetical protein